MTTSDIRPRIGVVMKTPKATIDSVTAQLVELEELGIDSAWMPGIPNGPDVLTMLAVAGRSTSRIQIGTAVIPTYPRHPIALAAQAMAVHDALGGRLTLGIGVSHKVVIEKVYGLTYDRPARHLREYLQVLRSLLTTGAVNFQGEFFRCRTRLDVAELPYPPPSVIVAALGPLMLQVAGEEADGLVTFMTGEVTTRDHIIPGIRAAAAAAGRPSPRIVLGMPVMVTDDIARGHAVATEEFALYGKLPAYQAMLVHDGATNPADIVTIGSAAHLAATIARYSAAGVTDFQATPFGTPEDIARTLAALAAYKRGLS